jgi:hypothetical protein
MTDLPTPWGSGPKPEGWDEYQDRKSSYLIGVAKRLDAYNADPKREQERAELLKDQAREAKREKRRELGVVTEHEEQKSFCEWMDAKRILYFSVPNGVVFGGMSSQAIARYRAYLRAEGLQRGAPDLVIVDPVPGSRVHVVVEMKSLTGKESPEQRAFLDEMEARGWKVLIAHGRDEAVRMMTEAGYGHG